MNKGVLSIFVFSLLSIIFFFVPLFVHVFAQATATSNCVITKVGNPPGNPQNLPPGCSSGGGNTDMFRFAIDLGTAGSKCNGGNINTQAAASCFHDNIQAISPAGYPNGLDLNAAWAQVLASVDYPPNKDVFQCVGFIEAVTGGVYGNNPRGAPLAPSNNAIDFAGSTHTTNGATYVWVGNKHQPSEGDYAVWSIGGFGHIAVVTKVNDNNHISVAEANWPGAGNTHPNRNVSVDSESILGYLHKQ